MPLYPTDTPEVLKIYLSYMSGILNRSDKTIHGYYMDLRTFFRYMKVKRGRVCADVPFEEIEIDDVDVELLKSVTLADLYEYIMFLGTERPANYQSDNTRYGNSPTTRARKVSSLRTYFKYLVEKAKILSENPAATLEVPKISKKLPKYLTIEDCVKLLYSVDGPYKERDYCILVLFLNCGLRESELVGLDLGDYRDNSIRVTGKGDKQRVIYMNEASVAAIEAYLPYRIHAKKPKDANAMFISREGNRISTQTIQYLVKKYLKIAGLSQKDFSVHKLRHTAATLMYQNGVDIRTLQEFLGHEQVNTTMIYTHLANESIRSATQANPLNKIISGDMKGDESNK